MSDHIDMTCGECGVEFCMPAGLHAARKSDHKTFYCPNGHPRYFPGKTEQEKRIESLERYNRRLREDMQEAWAAREDLIGAMKECPIPGCTFRSRKQIPRDPVNMGRGIERVRHDILEHLVRDHAGQASRDPLLLEAGGE